MFESPERFPDFAADVKSVSHARGYEGFYFNDWTDSDGNIQTGGCIEFATRTNSGARGGTYSVIIIDEAQELTSDEQEAMLPTVSAASNVEEEEKEAVLGNIYIGKVKNIVLLVDAFYAMTQDRPYRKAFGVDEIIEILM